MTDALPPLTIDGPQSPAAAEPPTYMLNVRFTGSGSEYFRIWIVNLLLMLVTLGFYFPWAKVRKLRYFFGNTVVDGEPLGFHGDPKKMFKGFLLVGVLFFLYSVAGNISPTAGFVAFLVVAALWPALFKSSLQFRLANTSWRGLRFRFHGTLQDAYKANLPLFIPGILFLGLAALGATEAMERPGAMAGGLAAFVGLAFLVSLFLSPWLFWNLKSYQHNHYGLGSLVTEFRATVGSFYTLSLKVFGFVLSIYALAAIAIGLVAFGASMDAFKNIASRGVMGMILSAIIAIVLMAFVFAGIKPYAVSRLQNLVWTKTGNGQLRFLSDLRFAPFFWLTLKNWLLIVITLGFYWPFAAVATARLRLEAVSIKTRISPDAIVSSQRSAEGDTAGDAAGDFFGLDIGL